MELEEPEPEEIFQYVDVPLLAAPIGEIEIPIITSTRTTQHECHIEWEAQRHVSYYMISILKLGADINSAREAQKLHRFDVETTLTDLEPATQYTILLTAFDANNKYKNSEHLIVETAGIPPSRPQRLVFQQVNSTALQISWGEPEFINGLLSGYIVEWSNGNQKIQQLPIPRLGLLYVQKITTE